MHTTGSKNLERTLTLPLYNKWSKGKKQISDILLFYRCLVQVAYAIGVAEPLSICVMDYGTSSKTQEELTAIVRKNFDLRPGKIVK